MICTVRCGNESCDPLFDVQELTATPGFGNVTVEDTYGSGSDLSYTWSTCMDEHHWTGTAATDPCAPASS